jgi:hypothetical protein
VFEEKMENESEITYHKYRNRAEISKNHSHIMDKKVRFDWYKRGFGKAFLLAPFRFSAQ